MDPKLPIRSIDYTVIFARQMSKMREFYAKTMGFALHRELSPKWVEYRVGSNVLALAEPGSRFNDMSLQLAFRVAPQEVDACAKTLEERGVAIVSPPTDQPFRDPDGNVLEIYAEIVPFANRT